MKQYNVYTKLDGHIGKFSGGSDVTIDRELSSVSKNAIANDIVTGKFEEVENGISVLSSVANELSTTLGNKVTKEEGKGLFSGSYNDLKDVPTNLATLSDLEKYLKANDNASFYFGVLNHKFGYYTTEAREESDFHEFGSSGFHVPPKDVYNVSIKASYGALTVSWNDPDDTFIEGVDISHWAGTILVMKADTPPADENDGTVVLTNTVRNQYAENGYVIEGLTNNTIYHLYFIPYNQEGDYKYSDNNRFTGMPAKVMLDDVTNISTSGADGSVTVNWTNPSQTKEQDGITATWVKTTVVVKADSQPTSATDGTAYESTDYSENSHTFTVDNGKDYYVGFFIESDLGSVTHTTYDTATSLYATVTVSTEETTLIGKTVTATFGDGGSVSGVIGSMGFAQLKIPYIGEVVLTATDGTDTANKTLTIEEWTSYSVSLSFTLFPIIYSNGEKFTDFDIIRAYSNETTDTCIDDGTKISIVRTKGTSGWNTGGGYIISEPIDFTGYNKLKFRITSHAHYAYVCVFTIFNKKSIASTKEDTTNSTVANATFSEENVNGVYEMDISNVNGENYLCLIDGRYTAYTATFDIHEIWLE